MEKARRELVTAGFDSQNVNAEIIRDVSSRASAIVQEAIDGNFNTIAIGRKGKSRVPEFTIGRVSNKVLQIGHEFNVWIIQ